MALARIPVNNGIPEYLTHFSMNVMGFLSVKGDTIYFTASFEGRDQLFALVRKRLFKVHVPVPNHNTGDYALQGSAGRFAWSSFTAVGYKTSVAATGSLDFEPFTDAELAVPLTTQGLTGLQKGPSDLLDRVPEGSYSVTPYPKNGKLINFHSWRPYVNDPVYNFSLVSENVLNTLQSDLFVAYNRNEQYVQVGADATYGTFFPWLDAGIDYTFDRNALVNDKKIYWNELEARGGFSVPLNFSRGTSFTNFQGGTDLVYNQRYYSGAYKDAFGSQGFFYMDPFINFTHQLQSAPMRIYPKWAQTVTLNYNQAVTTYQGFQFLASAYFYCPGLTPVHSLLLGAAFQQRDSLNEIRFSNNFPFSRGYSGENFFRMYRLTANYQFPLFYPDWGFGNMVYFLRIRTNLFYDYTRALDYYTNGDRVQPEYRSTGVEIYFDTKWWNQLSLSFGLRYSRLLDPDFEGRGPNQWEFILPLTLLGH
jgi:hypothetical protein